MDSHICIPADPMWNIEFVHTFKRACKTRRTTKVPPSSYFRISFTHPESFRSYTASKVTLTIKTMVPTCKPVSSVRTTNVQQPPCSLCLQNYNIFQWCHNHRSLSMLKRNQKVHYVPRTRTVRSHHLRNAAACAHHRYCRWSFVIE